MHVTSRLVKRIFVEVFRPRQGILKTFKTRDNDSVMAIALWTSLQSLLQALHLKSLGLKDLDIVASELVKFLLTNTESESVISLEKRVSALESSLVEVKKSTKGAAAAATTAGNKADEAKKLGQGLDKRLSKVEAKMG